jgi:nucleoside-diphosphate-sugar epimerase
VNKLFFGFPEDDIKEIYHSCINVWPSLESSNLLVMGGTGFVGKWLVATLGFAQLMGNSLNITVLSRKPKKEFDLFNYAQFKISWIENDVTKDIHENYENFDFIVNAATPSSAQTGAINPIYVYESIARGNNAVLSSKSSRQLRYIYLSSGAVTQLESIEPYFDQLICQHSHLDNLASAYSHGKRFAEIEIATARESYGLNAQSLRLYSFAGPGLPLHQHFAAGNFMRDALDSEFIEIKGNPKTRRSYMYPSDLTKHILQSLVSGDVKTREVGSTEVVSIAELAKIISENTKNPGIRVGDDLKTRTSYYPITEDLLAQTIELDESIKKWRDWLHVIKN